MHKSKTATAKAPADRIALLPTPFAFVAGGILATIAAQLYVSADDFRSLYEQLGISLPLVILHLVDHPVALPFGLLLAATLTLAAPRLRLPAADWAAGARLATMLATVFAVLYAIAVAYMLGGVFMEMQKSLQQ